jgi:hypothetical protein
VEGNSGSKLSPSPCKLSQAAAGNVSYNIATADGTAHRRQRLRRRQPQRPGHSGRAAEQDLQRHRHRRHRLEGNERFKVNLTGVSGATCWTHGIGNITNDD